MRITPDGHLRRSPEALAAVAQLDRPSDHVRLQVSCASSHHLAAVYDTSVGLVYRAGVRSHGHGRRDRFDSGHHGSSQENAWFDLLDPGDGPMVEDAMPAGCECGPRQLSRALLRQHIAAGERRIVLD